MLYRIMYMKLIFNTHNKGDDKHWKTEKISWTFM